MRDLFVWIGLLGIDVGYELYAVYCEDVAGGPFEADHPRTLTYWTRRLILRAWPGKILLMAGWLWLGYHFFVA